VNLLTRLFGYPHELLHLLALILIGRRAVKFTGTHVDIPDDLTRGQFAFVAGLPALVFFGAAFIGALGMLRAETLGQTALAFLVVLIFGMGAASTMGDLQLIAERLAEGDQ
jgi:hypothetical protein